MAKFSNLTLLEVRNRLDSWPLCKKNLVGSHWVEYLTIVTIIYTIVILPHIYIFEILSITKHQQQIVSSVLHSKVDSGSNWEWDDGSKWNYTVDFEYTS